MNEAQLFYEKNLQRIWAGPFEAQVSESMMSAEL
jgi:hypothetical protein